MRDAQTILTLSQTPLPYNILRETFESVSMWCFFHSELS